MKGLDTLRAAVAANRGALHQARAVHAQARRAVGAEIEAVNGRLAGVVPGQVLLDPGRAARYLRDVERRARLHEHLRP